jgi:uncharacterized protein (DUF1697 family)
MTRFVALLRGVNVGGVNIRMADLAETFRGLGYTSVKTVLASGNVAFDTDGTASDARTAIEGALRDRFGYDAHVHVLGLATLRAVVENDPHEPREGWHRYVVFFMDGNAPAELAERAAGSDLESASLGAGVLYWSVERGHTLDSPLGTMLGTAKWRTNSTNRNLNTLEKLLR